MARDYYSVLVRATSALDPNTSEARRAIYDRARLTIMNAGLPWSEVKDERSALEAAIDRIEADIRHAGAPRAPLRPVRGGTRPPPRGGAARPTEQSPQPARSSRPIITILAASIVTIAVVGYAVWP